MVKVAGFELRIFQFRVRYLVAQTTFMPYKYTLIVLNMQKNLNLGLYYVVNLKIAHW